MAVISNGNDGKCKRRIICQLKLLIATGMLYSEIYTGESETETGGSLRPQLSPNLLKLYLRPCTPCQNKSHWEVLQISCFLVQGLLIALKRGLGWHWNCISHVK